MARLIAEGFEAQTTLAFVSFGGGSGFVTGRAGIGVTLGKAWGTNTTTILSFSGGTEIYGAIAVKLTSSNANTKHLAFQDASGNDVFRLTWQSSGVIAYAYGAAGAATNGSVAMPANNNWTLLEFHFKLHSSTGAAEVHIDGITDLNFSGNTNPDSRSSIGLVNLCGSGSNDIVFDDLIINDTTGVTENSWPGDVRIVRLDPNGAGSFTQFTASTGTNWSCVDDAPNNGDTDYVQSAVSSNKDSYAMTDLPTLQTGDSVLAMQGFAIAKRANASVSGLMRVNIKSSTATDNGPDVALGTAYQFVYGNRLTTDPNTSSAWTATNLNAAETGVEVR